jgi:hypothetical protein
MKHLKTVCIIIILLQFLLQGCSTRHEKVLASAVNPSGIFKAEFVESKIFNLFDKRYYLKMTNVKDSFVSKTEYKLLKRKSSADSLKIKLIWGSETRLDIYIDNELAETDFLNLSLGRDSMRNK